MQLDQIQVESGRDRGERHRRDPELLQHAAGALALHQDEQPSGTTHGGDPTTKACGWRLPRRSLRADAGGSAAAACGRNPVGDETLLADEPAGQSSGHRLKPPCFWPHGSRSNTTATEQSFYVPRKIKSAKKSGRYPWTLRQIYGRTQFRAKSEASAWRPIRRSEKISISARRIRLRIARY